MDNAKGTVTVSTTGDVTVQVSGAKASTTFDGTFCQFPQDPYRKLANVSQEPCFSLNQSLVTDANGNGKLTFHFPRSGRWAGAFFFNPAGQTNAIDTRIDTDVTDTNGTVTAPLLPAGKVNTATADPYIPKDSPQEPGSGTVTVSGGNVTIKLNGGEPNTKYAAGTNLSYGGSAGQALGTFNTDASGNATATLPAQSGTGTMISVGKASAQGEFGLITGFTMP